MIVHRSIQLLDTRIIVKCLETSSGRKAWVKDGWKNVLSSTQAETTRGSEHSQQSAPPPKHNTVFGVNITPCFFLSRAGPKHIFPYTHVYVVFMYCNAFV